MFDGRRVGSLAVLGDWVETEKFRSECGNRQPHRDRVVSAVHYKEIEKAESAPYSVLRSVGRDP